MYSSISYDCWILQVACELCCIAPSLFQWIVN